MEAFEQLDLVAEISATLLGFITVFLALSKGDGRFSESDKHFIQAMVLSSALAIVLALAPRSISLAVDGATVWHAALIPGIILGFLVMFLIARHQLRMSPEEAAQVHWLWQSMAWVLGTSPAAMFLLAIFDSANVIPYYVGGVTLIVPLSIWCFIAVVFRRFF